MYRLLSGTIIVMKTARISINWFIFIRLIQPFSICCLFFSSLFQCPNLKEKKNYFPYAHRGCVLLPHTVHKKQKSQYLLNFLFVPKLYFTLDSLDKSKIFFFPFCFIVDVVFQIPDLFTKKELIFFFRLRRNYFLLFFFVKVCILDLNFTY